MFFIVVALEKTKREYTLANEHSGTSICPSFSTIY